MTTYESCPVCGLTECAIWRKALASAVNQHKDAADQRNDPEHHVDAGEVERDQVGEPPKDEERA